MGRFCKRILGTAKAIDRSLRDTKGDDFVDRLHASLPKIPGTSTGQEGEDVVVSEKDSDADVEKSYVDWASRVRFEYCDLTIPTAPNASEDETPHFKFYYNAEARMLANSDIPKRSLAIAKEVGIRPEGVWAGMSPKGKAKIVAELMEKDGGGVAMVRCFCC